MTQPIDDILAELADQSSPCQRVRRHHLGRTVAVLPSDFHRALRADDRVVVRLITDGDVIDCRAHPSGDGVLFAADTIDGATATRTRFLTDLSDADQVKLVHVDDSQFETEPDETDDCEIRTDGGIPDCDQCDNGGDVIEAPAAGYWYCCECGARGSGSTEPIWWHNDPDSAWYIEDGSDAEICTDGGQPAVGQAEDADEVRRKARQGICHLCDQDVVVHDGSPLTPQHYVAAIQDAVTHSNRHPSNTERDGDLTYVVEDGYYLNDHSHYIDLEDVPAELRQSASIQIISQLARRNLVVNSVRWDPPRLHVIALDDSTYGFYGGDSS